MQATWPGPCCNLILDQSARPNLVGAGIGSRGYEVLRMIEYDEPAKSIRHVPSQHCLK